ncbi:unnamed protein product [Prunus armeniaca]|uniref:Sulfotransferase n=1 Tax=Prunus armeniaca TaxID=36596 RepID=A0A6J5W6A7_PRUAR|nr:unnamed protein product [Prunus armeniaca]
MATPQPPPALAQYLQEYEFSQENRDFISSLPTGKRLGCKPPSSVPSTPKSGTTWLKAVLFALVKRVHYPDPQQHPLLTNNPHVLVPFLELNVVYLCRDPKDTFVSLWHFANKLRAKSRGTISLEEAFDKFCKGFGEMKEEPTLHLRRLVESLGCPFSPEEETQGVADDILRLCSFDNLSNLDVNKSGKLSSGEENSTFFRKGQVGDWMNYLTAEMVERLDCINEEKLQGSGLKF